MKSWLTMVTSAGLFGSRPALRMAAYSSASLPKPQLPTFLPFQSAGFVMPLSLKAICRVGERWKGCPMNWMSAPFSREARAFGSQLMPNSALPAATTVAGTMSTAPGRIVTSRPWSLK